MDPMVAEWNEDEDIPPPPPPEGDYIDEEEDFMPPPPDSPPPEDVQLREGASLEEEGAAEVEPAGEEGAEPEVSTDPIEQTDFQDTSKSVTEFLENEKRVLQQEVETLKRERQEDRFTIRALEKELVDKSNLVEILAAEVDALHEDLAKEKLDKSQVEMQMQAKESVSIQVQEKDKHIGHLQKELTEVKERLLYETQTLSAMLKDATQKCEEAEALTNEEKRKVAQLQPQLESVSADLKRHQEELYAALKLKEDLTAELATERTSVARLRDDMEDLRHNEEMKQTKLSEEKDDLNKTLQQHLQDSLIEKARVQDEMRRYERQLEDAREERASMEAALRGEIQAVTDRLSADLESEKAAHQQERIKRAADVEARREATLKAADCEKERDQMAKRLSEEQARCNKQVEEEQRRMEHLSKCFVLEVNRREEEEIKCRGEEKKVAALTSKLKRLERKLEDDRNARRTSLELSAVGDMSPLRSASGRSNGSPSPGGLRKKESSPPLNLGDENYGSSANSESALSFAEFQAKARGAEPPRTTEVMNIVAGAYQRQQAEKAGKQGR